jgi:hypothetical protein
MQHALQLLYTGLKSPLQFQIIRLLASTFNIKYPDGPRDAETIMIDNKDRSILFLNAKTMFMFILCHYQTYTLQYRNAIHMPGVAQANWVVAGDISGDGNKVLIKTYEKVFYWERMAEHIWETLHVHQKNCLTL